MERWEAFIADCFVEYRKALISGRSWEFSGIVLKMSGLKNRPFKFNLLSNILYKQVI
jgi:hypothetical protein